MTVRLDSATRRKVERLAANEGISLNEALNRLLREAPDEPAPPGRMHRYRLEPRKLGFGFDLAAARELASEMSDAQTLKKLQGER
ncbi:MAG: hypothetical protein JRG89_18905 [Deltaproteobacteria bacterium]|nr:hypothetical protein [Deltaproteobacteria bacterium]MBW2390478.1 hypothetical protein [Deltaproteobacteria bacterium]